jgi:outer membrane immunogenic protein
MVRSFLLSSVALVAIAGSAIAADLPARTAPPVFTPPPIPVFTWTGLYVGGQVGYSFGRDIGTTVIGAPRGNFGTATNVIHPNGIIGGAHAGYNYQFGGNFVAGLEGDIEGSSDSASSGAFFGSYKVQSPVKASIRGRVGFAVDRTLFYATGGAAFATFRDSYATGDSTSPSAVGYTVGGGIEYAISNNWSVRGEYRFSSFGSFTDTLPIAGTTVSHKDNTSQAELGFSYKFAEPVTPVVARY